VRQGNQENCERVSFFRQFFQWQQTISVVVLGVARGLEFGTISYIRKFH
jgi:hypothetical protein